jgi:hypothetical protein
VGEVKFQAIYRADYTVVLIPEIPSVGYTATMNFTTHRKATATTLRHRILNLAAALLVAVAALAPAASRAAAPTAGVPFNQALMDAQTVARQHEGWKVYMSHGDSMGVEFNGSSLLIADRADFSSLKPGMLVIYRDASGDLVSHRLISQTAQGWVIKGLNNDKVDPGLVTADNLVGVVFGIVNYQAGSDDLTTVAATDRPAIAYAKKY